MEYCLVLCTCPDDETARDLAESLVVERLAACVNLIPGLTSVYLWKQELETSQETLLLIKTEKQGYPQLESRLRELHPYEVPEIVAFGIEHGLPDYLNWISQCLSSPSNS